MDSFAPIGPAVVTKEDIEDPHNLNLSCMVNGEVKQVDKAKGFFCIISIKTRIPTQEILCLVLILWFHGFPSSQLFSQEISYLLELQEELEIT